MDTIEEYVVNPAKEFYRDSEKLIRKCTKPDAREFTRTAMASAIGLLIMGFVGFFIKLIFIPINNIIIGG